MEETAEFLAGRGYRLLVEPVLYGGTDAAAKATRYELRCGEHQHLVLETLQHPGARPRFYLEIRRFYGMRAYSYPLDSWKFFEDRIEFKFNAADTGLGHSFILDFAELPD
ncbi:MAG: hypothetical protein AAF721_18290 [Myxococcota bacterium]